MLFTQTGTTRYRQDIKLLTLIYTCFVSFILLQALTIGRFYRNCCEGNEQKSD